MSALLEWQRALRAQLLDDSATSERLQVHRNTVFSTLVNALRLSYPVVRLLVGDEFFEGATRYFIAAYPPRSANLNDYGESFAGFLVQFPAAAAITYLADVARLEWAVSRALHAPDATALDISRLATLSAQAAGSLRFRARPGVTTLRLDSPADLIWDAVLAQDDAAMAAVKPDAGPVHLLIERGETGAVIQRMAAGPWRFSDALLAGQSLEAALLAGGAGAPGIDATHDFDSLLAAHLRSGRFTDFSTRGEGA